MPCSGCAKRRAALLKGGLAVARVIRRVIRKPLPPKPVTPPAKRDA